MSLNGLDDLKIKEAHETAAAEPGGWFLLKYVSRDEVELLGRGNGGIVEIRNAIAQYEDPSPLFGFLRYRRRNVVIKYVPEECSRLVQARVTVHFNAVTERFSPHDTVFPITTSKELRDTTLSAACSLHTASGSTSSSTSSLRRRRLMEIAEDEEEETRAKRQSTVPEERPPTANTPSVSGATTNLPPSTSQPALPGDLPPSESFNSLSGEVGSPSKEAKLSAVRSISPEGRRSSQSMRPELHSYTSYGSNGRPKVKLGPRPSLDVNGRPHTSGAASYYRPVSTLPAGLKLFSRGSKKEKERPKSQYPAETPSMTLSPPPMPDTMAGSSQISQARPHTSGGRPSTSSGNSMKPLMSPSFATPQKLPTITPEKARLMKALELRKKQMSATPTPAPELTLVVQTEEPKNPSIKSSRMSNDAPKEIHDTLELLDDMAKGDDSGIAFDASSTLKTDESDATRSDSYPVSPVGPSEHAESTRASSISGSTDETVQEPPSTKQVLPDSDLPNGNPPLEEKNAATKETTSSSMESAGPPRDAESLEQLSPTTYNPFEKVSEPVRVPPTMAGTQVPPVDLNTDQHTAERLSQEPTGEDNSVAPVAPMSNVETIVTPSEEPEALQDLTTPGIESQNLLHPESPARQMKIPRSKFSLQELQPDEIEDSAQRELPSVDMETTAPQKSPVESTFSTGSRKSTSGDGGNSGSSLKRQKRRGLVEPIRTDLNVHDRSGANSDANFSSDDDLMDELSSAVVQEAKPMSVSKSPISPVFPSPKKRGEPGRFARAFSSFNSKDKGEALTPLATPESKVQPRSVSASAAWLNRANQEPAKPLAKKVNMGSGISQRIKALEKFSSLAPGATPPGTTGPPPGSSPAFFSVRKGSVRGTSKSPSIAERANSLNRNTPSPSVSRESSPETSKIRERSGSIRDKIDAFKSNSVVPNQPPRSRPESISVTARIIRDPAQPFPAKSEAGKDPADYAPLDLKQSPLVIDHQKAITEAPRETIQERRLSKERRLSSSSKTTVKERRSSITILKEFVSDRRSSFSERRKSMNLEPPVASPSVRSPSRPPSVHATTPQHRPMSISSRVSTSSRDGGNTMSPPPTAGSSSSTSDEKADKKSNRASRMMRRMSSSISAGRKNIAHAMSPTVREESEPANSADVQSLTPSYPSNPSLTPTSTSIGDVNVQFPDTLLWKRRSMLLDSQGYLIMSPALTGHNKAKDKSSGATRRFHLSEFRTPSIPDVEMQELPNSVVLDFIEGGGLQVACEDRPGQLRMLQVLQEAHRSWAAYGQ